MSITAKVYSGTSPGTLIATLNSRQNPNWLDQLNDPGSGSVQIHKLDSDLAGAPTLNAYYNIVRFSVGGTDRFAFIIENPDLPPVPGEESSGEWWTLSGRGVLALLDDAIVYPESALSQIIDLRDRTFGFMSSGYSDASPNDGTTWVSATQIQRQDAGTPVTDYAGFPNAPSVWPDSLAYWIWSRALSSGVHPAGTSYFRKTFTMASDKLVAVVGTCDNASRIWLDGEPILDNLGPDQVAAWQQYLRADRTLLAGDHTIAVEAANLDYPGTAGHGPAGLLVSVVELDAAHKFTTTIHERTSSSWKACDYPGTRPGMTPGEILRILIDEAQARGALTGITLGFTDSQDTASVAWSVAPDEAFAIGTTSVLAALRTLQEQFIDAQMTPALVLNAYNKGTLGTDLTGSVSLVRGTHFEELTGQSSGHLTNALLLRNQLGVLLERTDATSLGARKRIEGYAELGTAPSSDQAQRAADALFPDFAYPVVQLSGKVTEASGPYTTYKPGDKIKMPNKAGVATASDVFSLSVEEDVAGNPIYHIEASQVDS